MLLETINLSGADAETDARPPCALQWPRNVELRREMQKQSIDPSVLFLNGPFWDDFKVK